MSAPITIRHERRGPEFTIRIQGPIVTGRGAEAILARVQRALRGGARTVVLDLREVPVIDCGGMGLLLVCREAAAVRGATLRVLHARGIVRAMLRLAALLEPLQAEPGEAAAGERRKGHDLPLLLSA
jgi:anti-anti-sigma factor